jgi:hypothetical protein
MHVSGALPVRQFARQALDVARPATALPMDAALKQMSRLANLTPVALVRDFVALAIGPGRVSFQDYVKLRLFDHAFYAGNDRRQVVGQRRNRWLAFHANYRHDWMGMFEDKLASASYLAAFGLPVPETRAVFRDGLKAPSPALCRDRGELRCFLRREASYPLFGKPLDAFQSLGALALARYDRATDRVELLDGRLIALDALIGDIAQNYATGYLFQPLLAASAEVKALCGARVATVRAVTITTASGPQLFRACWKIPAGSNVADNYWRPGNLLAQIETTSGRILRVVSGTGLDLVQHTHHPDTGVRLIGVAVPQWEAIVATAIEGARVMRHMPLIGWDVAALDRGVTIIEMNDTPDLFLNQLADGRGVLDGELQSFLARQKSAAQAWKDANRRDALKL